MNYNMKDKLIILDLDETLIFSTPTKLSFQEDFIIGEYFIYKRPGLENFIRYIREYFQIAIWSSSSSDYAQSIVNKIFMESEILKFAWSRERCIAKLDLDTYEQYWIKDLKKVKKIGFDLEKILVIDDSREKLQRNYGNHIPVVPFKGDLKDDELSKLILYLDKIKDLESFRSIEKRDWRFYVSKDNT